jgi:hypothetical protein
MSNSFDIKKCRSIGCPKVVQGVACIAYQDPTILPWHRHGKVCPAGPYVSTMAKRAAKKVNPIKASKRAGK